MKHYSMSRKSFAMAQDSLVDSVTGRFAYESFHLLSVRLRLESIRLRPICQFDRRVSDDNNWDLMHK